MSTQPLSRKIVTPADFKFKAKPERDKAKNPTVDELMANPDKSKWVPVRIPLTTRVADVRFEPIRRGMNLVLEPGHEYMLPPEIAEDVEKSIEDFENVPMSQMTGNQKLSAVLQKERADRAAFEQRKATHLARLAEVPATS